MNISVLTVTCMHLYVLLLPPAYVVRREGNVLTPVCVSVHRGGSQAQVQVGGVPGPGPGGGGTWSQVRGGPRSRWGGYPVSGLGGVPGLRSEGGGVPGLSKGKNF